MDYPLLLVKYVGAIACTLFGVLLVAIRRVRQHHVVNAVDGLGSDALSLAGIEHVDWILARIEVPGLERLAQ